MINATRRISILYGTLACALMNEWKNYSYLLRDSASMGANHSSMVQQSYDDNESVIFLQGIIVFGSVCPLSRLAELSLT